MATDPLVVLIDGKRAGTLERTSSHHRFDYDEEYAGSDLATPLSVSMPLAVPTHAGPKVSAWLWGLLPDDDDVIARWAGEYGASRRDALSLLATPVGRDCAGAVQFAPESQVDELLARGGSVEWLSHDDVGDRLADLRRDSVAWHGAPSQPGQFSLAGAQSKLALLYRDGRWGVPSGTTPTTHILKPGVNAASDGSRLTEQALNEHLCMAAALRTGLRAAETSIMTFTGERAIVVTRYDRVDAGSTIRRIHQEDTCQALGVPPESKYESQGGPNAAGIVALLRSSIAMPHVEDSVERFVDALAFNWLIGGTDAHAKNYSLLLSGQQVRLAPLYDVASSLPYWHPKRLRLAMKLDGDNRVWPWRNRWPGVARQLKLDADAVQERVLAMAERTPAAFEAAIAALGPDLRELPIVGKLRDEVAAQCERCGSVLR